MTSLDFYDVQQEDPISVYTSHWPLLNLNMNYEVVELHFWGSGQTINQPLSILSLKFFYALEVLV
jgi:hypothetical protein